MDLGCHREPQIHPTRRQRGAPVVLPNGPIALGSCKLSAGDHELTFRVAGKNADSTQYSFDVDCIELRSIGGEGE